MVSHPITPLCPAVLWAIFLSGSAKGSCHLLFLIHSMLSGSGKFQIWPCPTYSGIWAEAAPTAGDVVHLLQNLPSHCFAHSGQQQLCLHPSPPYITLILAFLAWNSITLTTPRAWDTAFYLWVLQSYPDSRHSFTSWASNHISHQEMSVFHPESRGECVHSRQVVIFIQKVQGIDVHTWKHQEKVKRQSRGPKNINVLPRKKPTEKCIPSA